MATGDEDRCVRAGKGTPLAQTDESGEDPAGLPQGGPLHKESYKTSPSWPEAGEYPSRVNRLSELSLGQAQETVNRRDETRYGEAA